MIDLRAVLRSRRCVLVLLVLLATGSAIAASGCGRATSAASDTGGRAALYPVMVLGEMGYANPTGEMVIPPQFARASAFREGLAYVEVEKDGGTTAGYIDATGKMVVKGKFQYGADFSEGLAAITSFDSGLQAYIDRTGTVVIPGPFDMTSPFVDGLAVVGVAPAPLANDVYGVIDTSGRWVVPAQFKQTSYFSDGLCAVETQEGLWGYVDTAGGWR